MAKKEIKSDKQRKIEETKSIIYTSLGIALIDLGHDEFKIKIFLEALENVCREQIDERINEFYTFKKDEAKRRKKRIAHFMAELKSTLKIYPLDLGAKTNPMLHTLIKEFAFTRMLLEELKTEILQMGFTYTHINKYGAANLTKNPLLTEYKAYIKTMTETRDKIIVEIEKVSTINKPTALKKKFSPPA